MQKKIDFVTTILLIALGGAHLALTPMLATEFNSDPADFAAIGLAFVFLGLLNLARYINTGRPISIICLIANLLGVAWLCYSFVHAMSIEPQGILPFVALCFLVIRSIVEIHRNKKIIANQ
jgi:hypothetical protein